MDILLRFFIDAEETCIATINIKNNTCLIPQRGCEVCLDDILDNEEVDYDYYKVKNVCYSYGENITLVDVFVRGGYWEGEWDY